MTWDAIALALRRPSGNACCWAYGHHQDEFPDDAPVGEPAPVCPDWARPLPLSARRALAEPVKRPRYFSEIDADIIGRIARQGITAGFLGDPPPGRSALDQREACK